MGPDEHPVPDGKYLDRPAAVPAGHWVDPAARIRLDREENEYHVFCVGAVVMDFSNRPIGAISISGSTLTPQEEKEVSSMLLSSSRKLSGLLGYAVR